MPNCPVPAPPSTRPQDAPVLLVDHDHERRLLVSLVLSHAGHRVITAQDGQQAIDALDRGMRPQVMIVELTPALHGAALLRRVSDDPGLGGVLTVAVSGDESQLKQARAHATLLEPVDPDMLLHRVTALVRAGAAVA